MYNNRAAPSSLTRLLVGLLIVSIVVVVFLVSQGKSSPTPPTPNKTVPTAVASLLAVGKPATSATPQPITLRIVSDKAKISAVITELYYATDADNWDLAPLGSAAGHLEGTPAIGHGGNFVLAGHVELKDGSRGPFADLHLLVPGDRLTIIGDSKPTPIIDEYQVTDVGKVLPTDFAVMRNHGYEELTLITCDDYDATTQTYNTRVIIHARPVSAITPTAAKTATIAPTATPKKK